MGGVRAVSPSFCVNDPHRRGLSRAELLSGDAVPISGQRVAKFLVKRAEPRAVVFPLIKTISENGLTDLLGAWGPNAPPGQVEIDASLFER